MREHFEKIDILRRSLGSPDIGLATEDKDSFVFRCDVNRDQMLALSRDFLLSFVTLFGSSLDMGLAEFLDDQVLQDQPITNESLEDGSYDSTVQQMDDDSPHRLILAIDKSLLLETLFGAVEGRIVFFFYSDRLVEIVNRDLLALENELFVPERKLFVLVGEVCCLLVGPILHVLGNLPVDDCRRYIHTSIPTDVKDRLVTRLHSRDLETQWQNGAQFLVPEYLLFEDRGSPSDPAILRPLSQHLLDLVIISIANYTVRRGTGWAIRFEGQKRIEIDTQGCHKLMPPISFDVCTDWYHIYDWVYGDRTKDKLSIVRNLVTLQPYEPDSDNYGVLTSHPKSLTRSAENHFEKFIGDSVKSYFDKLKESSTYLQSKVDAVSQQISSLADTLVKNLLATAGFVIGTALARVFDPKMTNAAWMISLAFVAYMGLILIVYYPLMWKTHKLNCSDYEVTEDRCKRIFSQDDIAEFIGTSFKSREKLFVTAYRATLSVYVIFILLGGYYTYALHQTQLIFNHMGAQTINRGTFLIATFRRQGNATNFLAMLKMPDTAAAPYRTNEHGERHSVDIQYSPQALPQPQDRGKASLDKAAFIAPTGEEDAYELRILDRKHKEKGGVATYFQSFLNCSFPQTDAQKTKIFNKEVENWIREHAAELPPTLQDYSVREFKHMALNNNSTINVREFATNAFGTKHPQLTSSLIEHFKGTKLRDAEFEVDIQNLPKKKTYRFRIGSQKIEIKGTYDDMRQLVKIQRLEDSTGRYRVTIEADNFEEI